MALRQGDLVYFCNDQKLIETTLQSQMVHVNGTYSKLSSRKVTLQDFRRQNKVPSQTVELHWHKAVPLK